MGSLIINHNTQALNTHRNLLSTDARLKTSLEHLSSGERIVRAADGPAALMISEQMRAQVGSVKQAIANTETAVSMVQTTEAALDEVNRLLVSIRQLAVHAGNEGANDENMLAADQLEVTNALQSLDRIGQFATFGTKKLLDGSRGVNGVAAGDGLSFIGASTETRTSDAEGYVVNISRVSTKASVQGSVALTPELIAKGISLKVQEAGRVAEYTTKQGDDTDTVVRQLQRAVDSFGLQVSVNKTDDGRLVLTHKQYGREHSFVVVSTEAGILSETNGVPQSVDNGQDVEGTIGDQLASGRGQLLTSGKGARAEGLTVRYTGHRVLTQKKGPDGKPIFDKDGKPVYDADAEPIYEAVTGPVGRVNVTQNSPVFQIGPNSGQRVAVSLTNVSSKVLGQNVLNKSGFNSLSDVDVRKAQGAEDTMRVVDRAIDDVNRVRAELGAVQKNSLDSNIRSLRINEEELTSSESVIRDADMAAEMSELTRNQIMMQSGMAMLTQANQQPRHVLTLLQG